MRKRQVLGILVSLGVVCVAIYSLSDRRPALTGMANATGLPATPASTTNPTTNRFVDSPDFELTIGEGSGLFGYNVLKLSQTGACEYTFMESNTSATTQGLVGAPVWKRAAFSLDANSMAALEMTLGQAHLFTLNNEYHGNAADGNQCFVKLTSDGRRKSIFCDNQVPKELEVLMEFVHKRILDHHSADIGKARIIPRPKEAEQEHF